MAHMLLRSDKACIASSSALLSHERQAHTSLLEYVSSGAFNGLSSGSDT